MSLRVILALAAAFVATPMVALAIEYRVIGDDERAVGVVEAAIKTDAEGHKETVFYIGFSQPVSGPGGTQVVSSTILFDCEGNRYKVGATSTFKADMTLVERAEPRYGWRDVLSDSPFSRAASYACRGADLPRADAGEVTVILANYLARRAAAAVVAPAH